MPPCRHVALVLVTLSAAAACGSCDCDGGEPAGPRDDGPAEGQDDAGTPDGVPDSDPDQFGDAEADEPGTGEDGEDASDIRDLPDWGECGRDVPLWEREVGEEWCYEPPTRDLTPFRNEPSPGCEQVTYCEGSIHIYDAYDVWGDVVIFVAPSESVVPGILLVDTRVWREEVMLAWDPRATSDQIMPSLPQVTLAGGAVAGIREGGRPVGTYVLYWDRPRGRQRLIYADADAGPIPSSRGLYYVYDFFGSLVLAERYETSSDTNLRTIAVDTLENLPVTDFPEGRIMWDAQMWGDLVVFSGGSQIARVDLGERGVVRALAPNPASQWDPAIHQRRACWSDLRHGGGDPGASHWGEEIYCVDIDTGEVWNASQDPAPDKGQPTLFGDWVAWEAWNEVGAPWTNIGLYNRRIDRRWYITDRAAELGGFFALVSPRLWEPYVYFLGTLPGPRPQPIEVYRCRLPDLFPEAYE